MVITALIASIIDSQYYPTQTQWAVMSTVYEHWLTYTLLVDHKLFWAYHVYQNSGFEDDFTGMSLMQDYGLFLKHRSIRRSLARTVGHLFTLVTSRATTSGVVYSSDGVHPQLVLRRNFFHLALPPYGIYDFLVCCTLFSDPGVQSASLDPSDQLDLRRRKTSKQLLSLYKYYIQMSNPIFTCFSEMF